MADLADILAVPQGIADAEHAATAIADGVRASDVSGPVRAVGAALPGSTTAAAALDLAVRWQGGLTGLADAFAAQGDGLTGSAQAYRTNDQQLAEALQAPAQGAWAPPGGR